MSPRLFKLAAAALLLAAPAARAKDTPSDAPKGPVFCRYVPERKDDFAWENDLVAFRTYGPALKGSAEHENSGIDCWMKRTSLPILNAWYAGEQRGVNYHADHGQGYDGYHVGSSRGCGGTGVWKDGRLHLSGVYTAQKVISLEPTKCVFELTYQYDLGGGDTVQELKRITLEAGQQMFRSESTFTRGGQPAKGLEVGVGVATHEGRAMGKLDPQAGWMACWEVIGGRGFGTGVAIAPGRVAEMREIKSQTLDEGHVLLITRTDDAGREVHHAGFAWERAGVVKTPEAWHKYLADEAAKLK